MLDLTLLRCTGIGRVYEMRSRADSKTSRRLTQCVSGPR